ncbi:MAG: hypothetical protein ABSD48_18475, partial [Armatimonadota bacterium]
FFGRRGRYDAVGTVRDSVARGVAGRMARHVGPRAACDLLPSVVFPSESAHVWASPRNSPEMAHPPQADWLQCRARKRRGGTGAALLLLGVVLRMDGISE